MGARETINEIVALDDKIAKLREQFAAFSGRERASVLGEMFKDETRKLGERDTLKPRLFRVIEMLSELDAPDAPRILGQGLEHDNPDLRMLCAEGLVEIGEDGVDRLMPLVEEAMSSGGPKAEEMPFVVAELDDPKVAKILMRFLELKDINAVAAAIQALAERCETSALPALKKLEKDKRVVTYDDSCDEGEQCTIGELAKDAVEMIESEEEE
jgi:HEAT repeat protein